MIKNIVLDMGSVCCKWDVDYISSKLTTNKEDQEFLIKYLFQSPQWLQLDKGSISLKEAFFLHTTVTPRHWAIISIIIIKKSI